MSNLAALTTQRDGLLKKIREIEGSGNDVEKILEAIKNQRWYFIKNKGRLQVQIEQDLSSNYISGIHLIKKSVEQFIRSVVA